MAACEDPLPARGVCAQAPGTHTRRVECAPIDSRDRPDYASRTSLKHRKPSYWNRSVPGFVGKAGMRGIAPFQARAAAGATRCTTSGVNCDR